MFVRVQHGLAFGQVSDRVSKVIPPVSLSLERRFEGQGAVAHSKVSRCEDASSPFATKGWLGPSAADHIVTARACRRSASRKSPIDSASSASLFTTAATNE